MDMALIWEVEEQQSFCSSYNKDLVLSAHSVVATELIVGNSISRGHQVCTAYTIPQFEFNAVCSQDMITHKVHYSFN